ncbi:hypothetical protein PAAG_12678 [Paracoccidioides lutzii Pb01]|uniref:Uncharacterized protein n=1 Tax=Paracoccidioides lutzii (strain ATCC MYA-826 / Pb01) TaxID=502779 RepID=A0A0A2VIF4_PARBA|nr:hypothetical protein PAAG_12678 [Paracoccidioides lutzii Pb01]KGQ00659.1 hypothetical protein PAAG_12678 [Paracoccidioides lutzii Pb01]
MSVSSQSKKVIPRFRPSWQVPWNQAQLPGKARDRRLQPVSAASSTVFSPGSAAPQEAKLPFPYQSMRGKRAGRNSRRGTFVYTDWTNINVAQQGDCNR